MAYYKWSNISTSPRSSNHCLVKQSSLKKNQSIPMDQSCIGRNNGELHLLNLPVDLINVILSYCDIRSLGHLSRTCKQLYYLILDDYIWLKRGKDALATNQFSNAIKSKSYHLLSCRNKIKFEMHWRRGIYKEEYIFLNKIAYVLSVLSA